jgi:ribosomal protein S12 methylthiotransferase
VGRELDVIVDEYDPYTDSFLGRGEADAPEIDGTVVFTAEENLRAGDFTRVEIFDVQEDSLGGRAV